MRIAILAGFGGFDAAYSLCSVVLDQADGLAQIGHEVEIWALDNCVAEVPTRNVSQIIPCIPGHAMHTGEIDAEKLPTIADAIELRMRRFDPDAILTHDTVFQDAYKTLCEGFRLARERLPHRPAIHFLHSATQDQPRWGRAGVFKGDRIVYSDRTNLSVVARNYGVPHQNVHCLHMPRDIGLAQFHSDDIQRIIRKHSLCDRDIVGVFAASQPRLEAKGLADVVAVYECLKDLGRSVALVVADAHATKRDIEKFRSAKLGGDLIFTSEQGVERWIAKGLNPRELTDLRSVANLFVFASRCEMSPLVAREAMLAGHTLVFNSNIPALREFGQDDAIYAAWPEYRVADPGPVDGPDLARRIVERLDSCPINRARRRALREFSAKKHATDINAILEDLS